jgi:ABC-type nitrate/sulfonate/bicarbonate transport system ATPase subunit
MVALAENAPSSLRIRQVRKSFCPPGNGGASRLALDSTSFSVAAGELVSIIGPSGCGKSTLLRLLAGLDSPDSGELLMGFQPITGPSAERGLVFQDPNLFPWLTVRRNIEAGLVARHVLNEKRHEVQEFMELVGLEGFADAYPHHLSGGMAQRVALARALINHPKVLLLDEPLGALDAFTRMRMQDEVLRLWRGGRAQQPLRTRPEIVSEELLRLWQARRTTMVLVTHDIDEAIYMSDRIMIMTQRPGRIEQTIPITLSRPRDRSSSDFLRLRGDILEHLHFAGQPVANSQR